MSLIQPKADFISATFFRFFLGIQADILLTQRIQFLKSFVRNSKLTAQHLNFEGKLPFSLPCDYRFEFLRGYAWACSTLPCVQRSMNFFIRMALITHLMNEIDNFEVFLIVNPSTAILRISRNR